MMRIGEESCRIWKEEAHGRKGGEQSDAIGD